MDFPTYISMPFAQETSLPQEYEFQDVRYAPQLVEYLINRFCPEGGVVLDPFAGFGTTLTVANKMGRKGYGIEIDGDKIDYMQRYLKLDQGLIHGDVNRLFLDRVLPRVDLILTSPPYMNKDDTADALSGYRFAGDYSGYLEKMQQIFEKLRQVMKPDGIILVEISNLKHQDKVTTLAWDVGIRLSEILSFQGELIINWTGERKEGGLYNYGYDHSYCLVYSV